MTTGSTSGKARAAPAARAAPRPAPRKGQERRDEIAAIASGLFARNGFEGTTIRDIAVAAGLTKPALYYHFADKEALYEYVVHKRMTEVVRVVREAMERTDDPIEKILCFVSAQSARMDREREAWMMTRMGFQSIQDADRRRRVTELRDEFEHILRDAIAAAMEAGRLIRTDAALAARQILSSVNDVPRWLKPGKGLTAQAVALRYATITLRGLGADLPMPDEA